jgi:hypothetical protein
MSETVNKEFRRVCGMKVEVEEYYSSLKELVASLDKEEESD